MTDEARCRGQAVPVVLAVLLLASVLALGLVSLARAAREVSLAQAAADAAALAGVHGGERGARRAAQANDAEIIRFVRDGAEVRVHVRRHGVTRRARAGPVVDGEAGRPRGATGIPYTSTRVS